MDLWPSTLASYSGTIGKLHLSSLLQQRSEENRGASLPAGSFLQSKELFSSFSLERGLATVTHMTDNFLINILHFSHCISYVFSHWTFTNMYFKIGYTYNSNCVCGVCVCVCKMSFIKDSCPMDNLKHKETKYSNV